MHQHGWPQRIAAWLALESRCCCCCCCYFCADARISWQVHAHPAHSCSPLPRSIRSDDVALVLSMAVAWRVSLASRLRLSSPPRSMPNCGTAAAAAVAVAFLMAMAIALASVPPPPLGSPPQPPPSSSSLVGMAGRGGRLAVGRASHARADPSVPSVPAFTGVSPLSLPPPACSPGTRAVLFRARPACAPAPCVPPPLPPPSPPRATPLLPSAPCSSLRFFASCVTLG